MSVYARYKRTQEGLRNLVELLETTPLARRQRMIDIGTLEDPAYTKRATDLMMTFVDIVNLPDMELAEVLAETPPRMAGFAISHQPQKVKDRFLKNVQPQLGAEIKDFMMMKTGLREAGGAQLKLIETARKLEKLGLVKTKKIPLGL